MKNKIYFKNLNGLRFIAALIVLLSHVPSFLTVFGVDKYFTSIFVSPIDGEVGVLLFFALSGFLITYLLFTEELQTGTISIKSFYIRRALRIWPLYFMLIFLGLFVLPFIGPLKFPAYDLALIWKKLPQKILFFCLFMPNIVLDFLGFVPYIMHSWTIGAEEQFYFIWPILFKKIKNKIYIFIGVIVIYLFVYYFLRYAPSQNKYIQNSFLIWSRYPISSMAIGGIYAYLIFIKNATNNKIKEILFSKWVQIIMLAILAFFVVLKFHFKFLHIEIYSILLGYQVCNLAANPNCIISIENKVLNYLGRISYGLYMFHMLAIGLAANTCLLFKYPHNILLYPLAILFAILIASITYFLLEKYFIRKKVNYSTVISGDNAK